jgi:predicted transcriptional regulator
MTCDGEEGVSRVRTPVPRDADLTLGVAEASIIACAKPNGAGTRNGLVSVWYHQSMALTLRTDAELERALDLLCEQEGLSRQELVRRAVLDRAERAGHRKRVDAAAERAVERWNDVLHRLGTV